MSGGNRIVALDGTQGRINGHGDATNRYTCWDAAKVTFDGKEASEATLLYHTLAARDVQTLVLLGDLVVRLKPAAQSLSPQG